MSKCFDKNKGIGFSHRRLSIIDLSNNANQPMTSHCGNYIMVFNGEIYNYKEIAKTLGDINWKSNSDTEVILEAFAKWGVDFVNKLNGMFAIAIYDISIEKLYLFRDRMGIKPLYYFKNQDQLIFASELKSLKLLDLNLTINKISIYAFLHLGYIPKKLSIYNEIKKVNPGSILIYHKNILKEINYWSTNKKIKENIESNVSVVKNELKKLIESSVEKRLICDVPLGTFLSGGTDSSLITAVANSISSTPVNSFSIGFKEKNSMNLNMQKT